MTIINHEHGFVFVHIPKNAGTSVAHYLAQLSSYRDQEIGATELGEALAPAYRTRFGLHKHSTYAELQAVMGEDLSGYRSIAVVRDPVDRVRSIYSFLKAWPGWRRLDRYAGHVEAFEQHDLSAFVRSPLFAMPGPDRILQPQVSWLVPAGSDAVAVDHVLRFEALDDDLDALVSRCAWPRSALVAPLKHANRSRRGPRDALTAAARTIIADRYAPDYARLGDTR